MASGLSRESDRALATAVFGDTLPLDNILVTDLTSPTRPGRAFCWTNVDDSIILGLGDNYDNPMANVPTESTLIHELTYAWQITYRPASDIESIWESVTNHLRSSEDVYLPVVKVPSSD